MDEFHRTDLQVIACQMHMPIPPAVERSYNYFLFAFLAGKSLLLAQFIAQFRFLKLYPKSWIFLTTLQLSTLKEIK